MKKILFLLLFPSLALAQYQGNANQKITLGEQTTADGLVWRGLRADTTSKIVPFSDTSAYIILDTVEKTLWLYKAGQVPKWQQVGGSAGGGGTVTSITGGTGLTGGTITSTGTLAADTSFLFTQSDTLSLNLTNRFAAKQNNITLTTTGTSGAATLTGATLNIPQYSGGITDGDKGDIDVTNSGATWTIDTSAISLSGNKVTGTLPVANGGTNRTTMPTGYILHGDGTSVDTSVNLFWDRTNSRLGIGTLSPQSPFHVNASLDPDQFRITRLEQNNQGFTINAGAGRTYFLNYDGTNNVYPAYIFYSQKGNVVLTRMTIEQSGAVTIDNLAGIADVGADANGKLQAATSDMNLKNTIENSPFGLNEILHLKPVTFLYNDENRKIDSDVKEVGFIAQDVFDIIPNAVSSTGTGDLQLDYRAITATLTKAIQEQQALIKALEQRILNLENK